MCYDIKTSLQTQLKKARYKDDAKRIEEISKELKPYKQGILFHASGFDHPPLLIYTNDVPDEPKIAYWGLIPPWIKSRAEIPKIWNKTLLARGETMFEKASYKNAAVQNRCLIFIDGFYEHHHQNAKTYPYFIYHKDNKPLVLAGLWSSWFDKENNKTINSCCIVTTTGNKLMAKIHNNPKIAGPRMPLILPEELQEAWLTEIDSVAEKKLIEPLVQPLEEGVLQAHSVGKLRGKLAVGNNPEATEKVDYPELELIV